MFTAGVPPLLTGAALTSLPKHFPPTRCPCIHVDDLARPHLGLARVHYSAALQGGVHDALASAW